MKILPHPLFHKLLSRQTQLLLDLSILIVAFTFAYLLRFDFALSQSDLSDFVRQLPYVVLIQFVALYLAGVHKFIWRYIGLAEVKTFCKSALYSVVPLLLMRYGLPQALAGWRVPVSIIILDTLLAFSGVLVLRVFRRGMYERYEKRGKALSSKHINKRAVLLIGGGRAGVLAASEILSRGDIDLEIKGFVDDELRKQGTIIKSIKVLGNTSDLPRLVRELNIDHVVITIAQTSRENLRRIVGICESIPVKVRIIPGLFEILQGRVEVSRIRELQVEDLLGRDPVHLDRDEMSRFLCEKSVMVTGAGGSIGSELVRQIARFGPSSLLLAERAEGALFNIHREIEESWPEINIVPLVADIGDEMRMREIFAEHKPQVILHAAAHKHVPLMESNSVEAIKNNVLATRLLGELAGEYGVGMFVLISTDKAVRPTSMMGASKRVAELIIQDLNQQFRGTQYVAVRFGNVIGSAGSVIPIFREQISKGGPVTVTHPEMERYFMTIPEAAQLVLQASTMGKGGEIFILDMGKPVRIVELARDIIRLSGFRPDDEIDIVFTGMRPGEKLTEELQIAEEQIETRHPKIFINKIAVPYSKEEVQLALNRLTVLSDKGRAQEIRCFLRDFLPESNLDFTDEVFLSRNSHRTSGEFSMHG